MDSMLLDFRDFALKTLILMVQLYKISLNNCFEGFPLDFA